MKIKLFSVLFLVFCLSSCFDKGSVFEVDSISYKDKNSSSEETNEDELEDEVEAEPKVESEILSWMNSLKSLTRLDAHTNTDGTIETADINGDGELDLISLSTSEDALVVFFQNSLSFEKKVSTTVIHADASSFHIGDANSDGFLDLFIVQSAQNRVEVMLGDGTENFTFGYYVNLSEDDSYQVRAADFDQDGYDDFVVSSYGAEEGLGFYMNNQDGTFTRTYHHAIADTPRNLLVYDFDQDSFPDAAVAGSNSQRTFRIFSDGDRSFTGGHEQSLQSGAYIYGLDKVDIDGDGDMDMVATHYKKDNIGLFRNDGVAKNFTHMPLFDHASFYYPYDIKGIDINNDGFGDLIISHYGASKPAVFIGNGDFTFQEPYSLDNSIGNYSVKTLDIDQDGLLDLLLNSKSTDNAVNLSINQGDGTFKLYNEEARPTIASSYTDSDAPVHSPKFLDLNNDGLLDYIYQTQENDIRVKINSASGYEANPSTTISRSGIYSEDYGDVNGDGFIDIVVADYNNSQIHTRLNDGNGNFGVPITSALSFQPFRVKLMQINYDAGLKIDIVVAPYDVNYFYTLNGDGTGSFATQTQVNTDNEPLTFHIANINNDGVDDLIIFMTDNSYFESIESMTGNSDGSFSKTYTYEPNEDLFSILIDEQESTYDSFWSINGTGEFRKHTNDGSGGFTEALDLQLKNNYSNVSRLKDGEVSYLAFHDSLMRGAELYEIKAGNLFKYNSHRQMGCASAVFSLKLNSDEVEDLLAWDACNTSDDGNVYQFMAE